MSIYTWRPKVKGYAKNFKFKIKFRESFRPFAPSIMEEKTNEWFKFSNDSPYMLFVAELNDDKKLKLEKRLNKTGLDNLYIKRSNTSCYTCGLFSKTTNSK